MAALGPENYANLPWNGKVFPRRPKYAQARLTAVVILLLTESLVACGSIDDSRVGSSPSGFSTYAPLSREGAGANRAAAEAAERFAGTWSRNHLPDPEWRIAVLPLVTPEIGGKLTDLRESARAVGPLRGPALFAGEADDNITFTIDAEGGLLHVTVTESQPYWLVSSVRLDPH